MVRMGWSAGKPGSALRSDSAISYPPISHGLAAVAGACGGGAATRPSTEHPTLLIDAADIAVLRHGDGSDWLLGVGTHGKVRCGCRWPHNTPARLVHWRISQGSLS